MGRIGIFLVGFVVFSIGVTNVEAAKKKIVDKELIFREPDEVKTWTFTSPLLIHAKNKTSGPSITIKVYDANHKKLLFEETLEKGDEWKLKKGFPVKVKVDVSCPDFVSGQKRFYLHMEKKF